MKKLIIIIASLFVAFSAFGQSAKDIYNKYSDLPEVSAVYISPAMFRMIGKLPNVTMENGEGEDLDLSPIIQKLNGFYLLEIENGKKADLLFADVKKLMGNKKFEILFEAKEDGEVTRLYTAGNEKLVNSLVLTTKEEDSMTFIILEGNMDRAELENILAQSAK